jgi:transcriptional regulator with XRE-family HTH domain
VPRPVPSSSARHARQALADRLREIRLDAGLTARELARLCGWHGHSKVSKIEHGRRSPSAVDIEAWCAACGVLERTAELVAELRAADSMWLDWQRMERAGLRPAQESVRELYERTKIFRFYSSVLIPGPVQTAPYVQALLSTIRDRRRLPVDDVGAAVTERMDRQHVLTEGDRRFCVLLEENVLRHRIGGAEVIAGQLGHLLSVMTLPSVSLGIIPFTADRSAMWPVEMFFMHDETQVNVELVSGYLTVTNPREIAMYAQAFDQLREVAVFGAEARTLITTAIDLLD